MTNTKFTDFFINIKRMSSNYWKKAKTTILVLSKNPNKIEKKMYLLISVREIRKHHQEDVEKDQESSRWKKIWRAIARKAKRKKNWRKSKKKERNYHTFMTTQKRHHFFSFYDMYFYRHNCRAETIFFLTFRRTVVRRCDGTFVFLQTFQLIRIHTALLSCVIIGWNVGRKTKFTTVRQKVNRWLNVDREVLFMEVSLKCYLEDVLSPCKVWQLQRWEKFIL